MVGRGRSERPVRTGLARVGGDVRLSVGWLRHQRCCQAGSGIARSRARARSNWVSQGQRCGRCSVRRRAERVIRLAREKNRRRRVLVVTSCSPRPIRPSSGPGCGPSPAPPARPRWRRSGPRGDGSGRRRTSGRGWHSRSRRGGGGRPPVPRSPRPCR